MRKAKFKKTPISEDPNVGDTIAGVGVIFLLIALVWFYVWAIKFSIEDGTYLITLILAGVGLFGIGNLVSSFKKFNK